MFGRNKDINLSASIVNAVELVKQILGIRYGVEIHFGGPMRINPGTIEERKRGLKRQVSFETKFNERCPQGTSDWKDLLAIVVLEKNQDNVWVLDQADVRVIDPNDPSSRHDKSWWYHARYAMEHPFDTRLYISDTNKGTTIERGFVNPTVWRGHCIADRHESTMSPRTNI